MKQKFQLIVFLISLTTITALIPSMMALAQKKGSKYVVSQKERERETAESDIRDTEALLNVNEQMVTEGLNTLRQIDDDITSSENDIEKIQTQIEKIQDNITGLETDISDSEVEINDLRNEYLKAVKKMRVAKKRNSGLVFLFASKSLGEARRRMRYMHKFSDWRERRSDDILRRVDDLKEKQQQLVQSHKDANVALQRGEAAKERLALQKVEQQVAVSELRANSSALRSKIERRKAEARQLSGEISALIAEQQAKEKREAEERKKAEAERKVAEEKAAELKRQAELQARADAEARTKAEAKAKVKPPTPKTKPAPQPSVSSKSETGTTEYALARKRRSRSVTAEDNVTSRAKAESAPQTTASKETPEQSPQTAPAGFGEMKGRLPKPVSGSFRIISAFGVHPISPQLPDILDENPGIDAHVAKGATACAVYDGEVIKIYDRSKSSGYRKIVVVKHGEYITVYANIDSLSVSIGQKVKQGQSIGIVGTDFDDPTHGKIHFELWKNQTHLDPAAWIKI